MASCYVFYAKRHRMSRHSVSYPLGELIQLKSIYQLSSPIRFSPNFIPKFMK